MAMNAQDARVAGQFPIGRPLARSMGTGPNLLIEIEELRNSDFRLVATNTPNIHIARPPLGGTPSNVCIPRNLYKAFANPASITFLDTSLVIKVVKRLERKIDERLRETVNCNHR
jgi:hypothetical protein